MTSASRWMRGQTAILNQDRRDPAELPITRVARKYVNITLHGRERRFDIETGHSDGDYGYPDHLYTPSEWAEESQRDQIEKTLREKGIELRYGDHAFTTATLQGILHVLDQAHST